MEDRLQTGVLALFRQQIHLQKAVVRFALNLDQIRDLHGRLDLGEIYTLRRLTRTSSQAM